MEADDRQLLIKTHRGHEASARLLWDRHAPRLLTHARAIVREPAAADIVQTVMCRVLELPGARVREIRDVPAFLAAAVRREALNHVRSARRRQSRCEGAAALRRSEPAIAAMPLDVRAAVEALPRRLREVIVLKHVSDLTLDQIAAALVTNRNTVASRYRAALAALRAMLSAGAPDIEPALEQGAIRA